MHPGRTARRRYREVAETRLGSDEVDGEVDGDHRDDAALDYLRNDGGDQRMMRLLCLLGLHRWSTYRFELNRYPQPWHGHCLRCPKKRTTYTYWLAADPWSRPL